MLGREREFVCVERCVQVLPQEDPVSDVVDGLVPRERGVEVEAAETVPLELSCVNCG